MMEFFFLVLLCSCYYCYALNLMKYDFSYFTFVWRILMLMGFGSSVGYENFMLAALNLY
jgi:hypothetical protein